MATDATGTPTSPDNIPKFNVGVDAPTGNGSNAQMDAIQTALNSRVSKPTGVSAGDVPVWNGSGWVVPSGTRTGTKFLRDDGSWATSPATMNYRKVTSKTVNTTTAATDLLNSEISVAAGVLGTTGGFRLTAWGDWLNNTGSTVAGPRMQILLGGTMLLDTNASPTATTSTNRAPWRLTVEVLNAGSASAQTVVCALEALSSGGFSNGATTFLTGEGLFSSLSDGLASTNIVARAIGINTTAVNTASACALVLNIINGSSSANYETKLLGAVIEII